MGKRGSSSSDRRVLLHRSLYIYIYIYLCSGYHAAGGMLIYTKRQDLCGRTARLSRNTAPELSRVGRNDTAKKGRGRSRNRETTRRPCYRSTPAQHYRAIYDPFQKISPTTRAEISSNPEDFSSPRRFLLPPLFLLSSSETLPTVLLTIVAVVSGRNYIAATKRE